MGTCHAIDGEEPPFRFIFVFCFVFDYSLVEEGAKGLKGEGGRYVVDDEETLRAPTSALQSRPHLTGEYSWR
jgi:hypothetical protein